MAATRVVVDANALGNAPGPTASGAAQAPPTAAANKSDTLFGPNIGILGAGPEWTERPDKSEDVLTPEIVKGWIAKSKEVSVSGLFGIKLWNGGCGAPLRQHNLHCYSSVVGGDR